MKNTDFSLKYSFPKLTSELLDKLEIVLIEKFDYAKLPKDYRAFLLENNGGHVMPGYNEEYDVFDTDDEGIAFTTPLRVAKANNIPFETHILSFFCVWLEGEMNPDLVEKWEMFDLIESNKHSKFEFDILPEKMMSIAKCNHNDFDDLLCMSLDDEDYGSIYYYYGMWYYPQKWMGDYYENKKQEILDKYKLEDVDIDKDTYEGKRANFELDRVPFVKIADSFTDFLGMCRIIKKF